MSSGVPLSGASTRPDEGIGEGGSPNNTRGRALTPREGDVQEADVASFNSLGEADGLVVGGVGQSAGSDSKRATSSARNSCASARKNKKRSKVARLARRWAWLKFAGGYVQRYAILDFWPKSEDLRAKLEGCQHVWLRERRGEDIRWRGIGCGERQVCPLCGSYRQMTLAREASEAMLLAQTGCEICSGIRFDNFGLKLVLTIPKIESVRIDGLLLQGDYSAWQSEVGRLFKAAYAFVRRWFGAGCGGVASLDYAGGSAPADAHYHVNVYVFPARWAFIGYEAIGHWVDKSKLADMRADWTSTLNSLFRLKLKTADLNIRYLGKEGQLHHWLQYLYRHPLSDLWRGWAGVEGNVVKYKFRIKRKRKVYKFVDLTSGDIQKIAYRLQSIPAKFKRIRWFGMFSDAQRSETMDSLGLEGVDMDEKDDGDAKSWVRDGEPARFVRYVPEGVVLRTHEGVEFLVPDSLVDYRPSGVSIGKRKRWREPGGG